MESWQKFPLDVVRHPDLQTVKVGSRYKILEFLALSVKYGPPGVVSLYDDAIARYLGIPLHSWYELRDTMLLREMLRPGRLPNGRRAYAVAYWLLPDQSDAAGKNVDGRPALAYDDAATLPLDLSEEPESESEESAGAPLTGAERVARYRYRAQFAKDFNRLPTRQELDDFHADYRTRHPAPAEDVTESCNDSGPESEVESVTEAGNVTSRESTEKESFERDNNNTMAGCNVTADGNGEENRYTETERYTDKAVVVAASQSLFQTVSDQGEEVIAGLVAAGVTESTARDDLLPTYGLEACRNQLLYLPFHKKVEDPARLSSMPSAGDTPRRRSIRRRGSGRRKRRRAGRRSRRR
jgi:hypothetical protein